MIDLQWNFPLLREQEEMWRGHLMAAMESVVAEPVEAQRPSFRGAEMELRRRAAAWLGTPVERTWLSCGGHHGTLVALFAAELAGKTVAVEGATYPGFLDQCRATSTGFVACAIDELGIVPESLREVCRAGKVSAFFTMPTVQNPMGFVTPLERRREVVEVAREFDLTIIEDDAYGYMEPGAPANYAELAPERTFYVRGLAKSFSPAVRTGFMVVPEGAAGAMVTALRCTATGTSVPQNLAALALCEDGTLARVIADKVREGAVRNAAAREVLGDACAAGAAAAWHLWVRLPETVSAQAFEQEMAEAGVLLSAGTWCAAAPEYAHGVRVALGGEVERERMLEGVKVVAEALGRL